MGKLKAWECMHGVKCMHGEYLWVEKSLQNVMGNVSMYERNVGITKKAMGGEIVDMGESMYGRNVFMGKSMDGEIIGNVMGNVCMYERNVGIGENLWVGKL